MVQQCQWPHILGACSPSRNDGVDYKEVEDEVGPVGEGGANDAGGFGVSIMDF